MRQLLIITSIIISLSIGLWAGSKAHDQRNVLYNFYVEAQEALAADNFKAAKDALESLTKNSDGEIKTMAASASKAADLKALRQAFKSLSEHMAKAELPSGLAVAYCPMAKAHWVQKDGEVANPYYGSAMLRCGSIKKRN